MLGQLPILPSIGQKSFNNFFSLIVDKKDTPFVEKDNKKLLKRLVNETKRNIGIIILMEYGDKVYYCSSSIMRDLATKDELSNNSNLPTRMGLIASLLNIHDQNLMYLISVLDTKIPQQELSTVVNMITKEEVNMPEETKSQMVAQVLIS